MHHPRVMGERPPIRRQFVLTANLGHLHPEHPLVGEFGADARKWPDWAVEEGTSQLVGWWKAVIADDDVIRYAAGQVEVGSKEGRLHAQAYVETSKGFRAAAAGKRWLCHVELRNGTREQARDYCTKSETQVMALPEKGQWRPDPTRTEQANLDAIVEMVMVQGLTPRQVCYANPRAYAVHYARVRALYEAKTGEVWSADTDPGMTLVVDEDVVDYAHSESERLDDEPFAWEGED